MKPVSFPQLPFFFASLDLLGRLLTFSFPESKMKEGSNSSFEKVIFSDFSPSVTINKSVPRCSQFSLADYKCIELVINFEIC